MKKRSGFTLLEIIAVLAIIGVTFTIGAIGSRAILRGQEFSATLRSIKQLFWQGATIASSRSINLELVRTGSTLQVRRIGTTTVYRTVTLPTGFTSNLPDGQLATFTPPGKVTMATSISNPFTASFNNSTYQLTVTQIGEVKEVKQ
jgi:prepilin-type N-terminal cleavage/methylation domain-containing protein